MSQGQPGGRGREKEEQQWREGRCGGIEVNSYILSTTLTDTTILGRGKQLVG